MVIKYKYDRYVGFTLGENMTSTERQKYIRMGNQVYRFTQAAGKYSKMGI
jgi:hypothetical protein